MNIINSRSYNIDIIILLFTIPVIVTPKTNRVLGTEFLFEKKNNMIVNT